ncbi:MAG: hypothetical protein J5717_08575 [Lachnospiraceae bacterium]|nr:hypothetical protein [Lachnospiraceae bacterium]
MNIPKIYTADGELYVRDSKRENRIDVVIQHMWEKGFAFEEIVSMLRVEDEFVRHIIEK